MPIHLGKNIGTSVRECLNTGWRGGRQGWIQLRR